MKRYLLLILLSLALLLNGVTVFAQQDDEEEGTQLRKLRYSRALKLLEVSRSGPGQVKVNLLPIKNSLESAGIRKPVRILVFVKGKEWMNLGTFSPAIAGKSGNNNGGGSGPKPNNIRFRMPHSKNVRMGLAMKSDPPEEDPPKGDPPKGDPPKMERTRPAVLVFQNLNGKIMAKIAVKMRGY